MKALFLFLALSVSLFAQTTKVGGSGTTKVGGSGTTKVGATSTYSGTPNVLWWKGNTGSGTTDTATVGPNLTLSSASIWGTTFTPGGSSNDLVLATTYYGSSASAVNPATNVMTVEFRIYQTSYSTATAQFYLCTQDNVGAGAGHWKIYNDTNGNNNAIVAWWSDGAANNCVYSIARPSTSAWHHLAFVMNNSASTALVAYVDGSSVSVTTVLNQWASSANFQNTTLRYGSTETQTLLVPGGTKDVRIFAGARSSANILLDATNYP